MKIKAKLVKAANTKSNKGFDVELKNLQELLKEVQNHRHDENTSWGIIQDTLWEAVNICQDLLKGAKARDESTPATY